MDDANSSALATPCLLTRRQLLKLGALGALAPLTPAWLTGCGRTSEPAFASTIRDAQTAIRQSLMNTHTPSISAALVGRDHVIWGEAFGMIDKATQTAPSTETLYCIGSCSKVVSAVAIMVLVDRGHIDLDAPLVRYLPQFRMAEPGYEKITVRMLLNHTSGFPGADYRVAFLRDMHIGLVAEQTLATLAVSRLKHIPGEMAAYCNDGFTMLEPLVQAVTGRTFTQFVAEEVLTPLGMNLSRYSLALFPEGSYAPGYLDEVKQPLEVVGSYATGGLYTTPVEMGRMARMLLNGGRLDGIRFLSQAAVSEMGRNQLTGAPLRGIDPGDDFGLGWDSTREDGIAYAGFTAWQKNGGTLTYATDFFVAPDEGLAVIVSGASSGCNTRALAERILLNALVECGRLVAIPSPAPIVIAPVAQPGDEQLASLPGFYADHNGMYRVQLQTDGSISLTRYEMAQWQTPASGLTLRRDGSFTGDALPDKAYRVTTLLGRKYLVSRARHGMGLTAHEAVCGQEVRGTGTLSSAWSARLSPRRWLPVNQYADSVLMAMPFLQFNAQPELPGYVFLSAPCINATDQIVDVSDSDILARMCLKIPYDTGRDLNDVTIETRNGEEWVVVGSSVFRPLESVLALGSSVMIGADGYSEWRTVPRAGSLSITGAQAWKLYDVNFNLLASGSAPFAGRAVAAGMFILFFGAVGAKIDTALV